MKRNLLSILIIISFFSACNKKSEDTNAKITEVVKHYIDDLHFKENFKIDFVDFKINKIDSISLDSVRSYKRKNKLLEIAYRISTQFDVEKSEKFDPSRIDVNLIDQAKATTEYRDYLNELNTNIATGNGVYADVYLKCTLTKLNTNFKENKIYDHLYVVMDKDLNVISVTNYDYNMRIRKK